MGQTLRFVGVAAYALLRDWIRSFASLVALGISKKWLDSDPNTDSFVRVRGAPSRAAEGKRRGGHTWRMRSSPAKGWAKTGQMARPVAQSAPPGKEEHGRRE